jgi:hypothetical protein
VRASRVKLNSPSNRERSSDDSKHSDVSSSSRSSEVVTHEPARLSCEEPVKQGQASPLLKHLVRTFVLMINPLSCVANSFLVLSCSPQLLSILRRLKIN